MESRSRYPVSDSVTAICCFSSKICVTNSTKGSVRGGSCETALLQLAGRPVEKRRFIRGVTASFGVNFQCRGLATLMPTQNSDGDIWGQHRGGTRSVPRSRSLYHFNIY